MAFAIRNAAIKQLWIGYLASLHGSGSLGIGLPPFPLTRFIFLSALSFYRLGLGLGV